MTASKSHAGNEPSSLSDGSETAITVFRIAFALAAVHLLVLAVRPAPTVLEVAAFEGVLAVAVVGTEFWLTRSAQQALALGAVLTTAVAGVWSTVWLGLPLWQVTAVSLGFVTLLGYVLHRYQLVRLGHVEGSDGR
jgi:hypothetical protein